MAIKSAWVSKQDAGDAKMQELAGYIASGAMAFLKAEWKVLGYFAVIAAIHPGNYNHPRIVIGYRIYEGDASSVPVSSLVQVGGCDSLVTQLYGIAKKSLQVRGT